MCTRSLNHGYGPPSRTGSKIIDFQLVLKAFLRVWNCPRQTKITPEIGWQGLVNPRDFPKPQVFIASPGFEGYM
jgi:hypothetical protein